MPDLKLDLDQNVIWIGGAGFKAHHDRLIVLQDDWKSGLECPKCLDADHRTIGGKEVSVIKCDNCGGKGTYTKSNSSVAIKCSICGGDGTIVCPECGGKGGTIVFAENTKGRPTTGTIVSIGQDVSIGFARGDKVIYPSFSGFAYDLKGTDKQGRLVDVVLVILRDEEILSLMYGSLEAAQVNKAMALGTNA